MAFKHRKLFTDPINATVIEGCTDFCDPTKNKDGRCPISCMYECSGTCYRSFLSEIPPPNPPTTPYVSPSKPHQLSTFLIISLCILAAIFFIFCCYTIYKFYTVWYSCRLRRRSQPQEEEAHDDFLDEDHGPVVDHPIWYIRTVGLQPSVISAITVCQYKRGDGLVEGTECSVCLNEFQVDEALRLLPKCNHAFHITCIDTWLSSHTNCPICRAPIVNNVAGSPSPEQSVENSGLLEEPRVGILESNGESEREREDQACELRLQIEEESESEVENGIKCDESPKEEVGSSDHLKTDEVQPMRRSVSVDSLSASMISMAAANAQLVQSDGNSDTQLVKVNGSNMGVAPKRVDINQSLMRLVGSSSIGKSLQKRPFSMKRSFSCSGKVLLSRHSRSQNLVLPS